MRERLIHSLLQSIPDLRAEIENDEYELGELEKRPVDSPRGLKGPLDLPVVEVNGERIKYKVPSEGRSLKVEADYMQEIQDRLTFCKSVLMKAERTLAILSNFTDDPEFVEDYFSGHYRKKDLTDKYGLKNPNVYMNRLICKCFNIC